jgi:hypothetical protein
MSFIVENTAPLEATSPLCRAGLHLGSVLPHR